MDGLLKFDAIGYGKIMTEVSENMTIIIDSISVLKEETRQLSNKWKGNDKRSYIETLNQEISELESDLCNIYETVRKIDAMQKGLIRVKRQADDLVNACLFL